MNTSTVENEQEIPGDITRQKLLDTAEQLFAGHGFGSTSVREITTGAGCNIAAVNYHFRDKQGLYRAVFERLLETLREHRIGRVREAMTDPNVDLEQIVRVFATAFLEPLVEESRGRLMMQLMMREMMDPQLPPSMLFEQLIDPIGQVVGQALAQTCCGLSRHDARLCLVSLVGQLIQLMYLRNMTGRADPPVEDLLPDLQHGTDHAIRFSVAGIRACADGDKSRAGQQQNRRSDEQGGGS